MKCSTSNTIGVLSFDYDPPKGGLGRAIKEMVNVLQEKGMNILVRQTWCRIPFFLQYWIGDNNILTLLIPVGPGGLFLLRKPTNVRTIVICYHTYWQQCRMVPASFWKRMFVPFERRTLMMADKVLCYCKDTQRVLKKEYGLKNVKLMIQILYMLEAKSYNIKTKSYFCLYVGRKDRRKGYDLLMKAWENIKKNVPQSELYCLTKGNLTDQELHDHMIRADLVIVPSYLEGFGLVAAEAMVLGKAVLGCDSDGLRSLIRHGETGWLVPPGDSKALADACVILLKNNILRERLGSQASIFMREKFNRSIAENELVVECGTK